MKLKSLALAAMSTLILTACGGGDGGGVTIDAGNHIKGTVAGTTFKAETDIGGHTHGDTLHIWASVGSGDTLQAEWDVYGIPQAKGTYACHSAVNEGDSELVISLDDYTTETSYFADGTAGSSCSITVVAISDTEISGTFQATLAKDIEANPLPTVKVTNGTFRIPLDNEMAV